MFCVLIFNNPNNVPITQVAQKIQKLKYINIKPRICCLSNFFVSIIVSFSRMNKIIIGLVSKHKEIDKKRTT